MSDPEIGNVMTFVSSRPCLLGVGRISNFVAGDVVVVLTDERVRGFIAIILSPSGELIATRSERLTSGWGMFESVR